MSNFSSDVKDGENYSVLLAQIGSEYGITRSPLQIQDLLQRAEAVLDNADRLGCRKFLTPTSLVAGNPKLNLAFVANLFNTHPALDPITEEEKLEVEDFDAEGEREARVFTLWLNSLDVQPNVQSFFDDLRDGTILLQAYDKVIRGSVNWRHVNKRPSHGGEVMRFKAVENTNYAIELGKQNGFSLVGIQGADITDGQKTLTLGLVWQLMRKDITLTLSALAQRLGKREITDNEMVRWANDMSRRGGRNSAIRSFKDPAIGTGVFLLDVLNGMKSSYVDYDLVTAGHTDDDAYLNAKLSISIARKLGATIWLVPEDICQIRSRLVTTFIGMFVCYGCGFRGSSVDFSRLAHGDVRQDAVSGKGGQWAEGWDEGRLFRAATSSDCLGAGLCLLYSVQSIPYFTFPQDRTLLVDFLSLQQSKILVHSDHLNMKLDLRRGVAKQKGYCGTSKRCRGCSDP